MNEVLLFIGKKSTSHVGFRERRLAGNKGDQTKGVDKTGMPEERKAELHGEDKRVMEFALQAGHILLENGAEIFRVEETIDRICRHYGLESGSTFVLSNGIFITAGNERENFFAKVQHIPVSGTHLDRVTAVNQLSREIEQGAYTLQEAARELTRIKNMPGKRKFQERFA